MQLGLLQRDVRSGLFHKVTDYSTQEVNLFGAPSLITRITNDVTQVQMFVLMTCTLMIAAPITLVGGTFMAWRQEPGLVWILAVSIPVLVIGVGIVVSQMVPQFRVMQERIDRLNQVLREQITGIRVVRAFVREPAERERFAGVNDALTDTALRAGRLQAWMFPIVMLVLNGSSVAVLWFGAQRIDAGQMQIGSLVAFLNYLTQILLSVMMATFLAVLAPRSSVCVPSASTRSSTRRRLWSPRPHPPLSSSNVATSRCATSASGTRGPRRRCSATSTWRPTLARPRRSSAALDRARPHS